VLPLIALVTLVGLSTLKVSMLWNTMFLAVGIYGSSILFFQEPYPVNADKAGGWALTFKYGHHPEKLYGFVMASDRNKEDLVQGIGWGMSAEIFSTKNINEPAIRKQQLDKLFSLLARYPDEEQENLVKGIYFAFDEGITPVLNSSLQDDITSRIYRAN